jgi:hypothetical protein
MQDDPDGSAAEQSPAVSAFGKSSEASQVAAGQRSESEQNKGVNARRPQKKRTKVVVKTNDSLKSGCDDGSGIRYSGDCGREVKVSAAMILLPMVMINLYLQPL